jgi:hypothetical protein
VSDPVEAAIEEALCPGRYVSEHASFSLVSELESVAARIAGAAPERAARLYETFIAACYEKADEVDDSSGFSEHSAAACSPAGSLPGRQRPPTRPTQWPGCLRG